MQINDEKGQGRGRDFVNPYSPPAADSSGNVREKVNPAIGIVAAAIISSLLLGVIGLLESAERGGGSAIGIFIGSLLPGLVIVAVFQLWRRFRNRRSRWNVYATTQCVILISEISRYVFPQ